VTVPTPSLPLAGLLHWSYPLKRALTSYRKVLYSIFRAVGSETGTHWWQPTKQTGSLPFGACRSGTRQVMGRIAIRCFYPALEATFLNGVMNGGRGTKDTPVSTALAA